MVTCPDCFGDGIETCHNPDHGFLQGAIAAVFGANESACPCCGHREDHKMIKFTGFIEGKATYKKNKCDTCKGSGSVSKEDYDSFVDEFVPEDDVDYVNEICLKD